MFISADEAYKMAWEARHITNFGIFCKEVNNEIELAAKRGCYEVIVISSLIQELTKEEKCTIKNVLEVAGYKVKWKKSRYDERLHIMWEVNYD